MGSLWARYMNFTIKEGSLSLGGSGGICRSLSSFLTFLLFSGIISFGRYINLCICALFFVSYVRYVTIWKFVVTTDHVLLRIDLTKKSWNWENL